MNIELIIDGIFHKSLKSFFIVETLMLLSLLINVLLILEHPHPGLNLHVSFIHVLGAQYIYMILSTQYQYISVSV